MALFFATRPGLGKNVLSTFKKRNLKKKWTERFFPILGEWQKLMPLLYLFDFKIKILLAALIITGRYKYFFSKKATNGLGQTTPLIKPSFNFLGTNKQVIRENNSSHTQNKGPRLNFLGIKWIPLFIYYWAYLYTDSNTLYLRFISFFQF